MYIFSNDFSQVFGQLALAMFLGALIGAERRLAHKMAGMRTFALVCMGASLFTIISQIAFLPYGDQLFVRQLPRPVSFHQQIY